MRVGGGPARRDRGAPSRRAQRRSLCDIPASALASTIVLLLSGCVYGVDDYDLPAPSGTRSAVSPPAPSGDASPLVRAPRLRLPGGCAIDDVRIGASPPSPGEAGRLVAVRTQTVRAPDGSADGTDTDRLVIDDVDLGNGPRITGEVRRLVDPEAWVALLVEQFRESGVVPATFGGRVPVSSFLPALDENARFVLGYVADEQRVPFTVTACDGSRLGSGELVGFDPAASGGSVVLRCGAEPASEPTLTERLAAYCDN